MNSIKIYPGKLQGKVNIPPSKSLSHRAIICAALTDDRSTISNLILSDDILATINGMRSLGACIGGGELTGTYERCAISIKGNKNLAVNNNLIDCHESGSTLRFIIPLAGLLEEEITFIGRGKLVERPLGVYYKIFKEYNIEYKTKNGMLPLSVKGLLKSGTFRIAGNVSSQFITGLMLALPLLKGQSRIGLTTGLESKGYIDLTLDVLQQFSIEIINNNYREFVIPGRQEYRGIDYWVEGDYSQAAFWIGAGLLGGNIECWDLNPDSLQGDKAILEIIKKMGGKLDAQENFIETKSSELKAITINAAQFPDLVPILATLAAVSDGTTKITNAERLRIKESDRLKSISTELNKIGANIKEIKDGLIIKGKSELTGGIVDSWNDHRIAMALAVASIKCSDPLILTGSGAVNKSYPAFWKDFVSLGGKIYE